MSKLKKEPKPKDKLRVVSVVFRESEYRLLIRVLGDTPLSSYIRSVVMKDVEKTFPLSPEDQLKVQESFQQAFSAVVAALIKAEVQEGIIAK